MGSEMKKLIIGVALALATSTVFAQEGSAGGAAAGAGGAAGSSVTAVNVILITFGVVAIAGIAASNDSSSTVTHQ